jgi:probable F420-dependent oxidoreductase
MISPVSMGPLSLWGPPEWHDRECRAELIELTKNAEALGFGSIWIGGGFSQTIPDTYRAMLERTERLFIASGVLSIWHTPLADVARYLSDLPASMRDRFLWGFGASHAPFVEAAGMEYRKPLSAMVEYLDTLDSDPSLPQKQQRVLAALGPRMLSLAGQRSLGAHPYLVSPAHTRTARSTLGPDALLVPELAVAVEEDPTVARMLGRRYLARYLTLPNYTNNMLRLGFSQSDLAHDGSDTLVDGLVAWGSTAVIATRIQEHLDAGANSVAVRLLPRHQSALPHVELSALAGIAAFL